MGKLTKKQLADLEAQAVRQSSPGATQIVAVVAIASIVFGAWVYAMGVVITNIASTVGHVVGLEDQE